MPGHPNSAGDETMICTCQSRERIQWLSLVSFVIVVFGVDEFGLVLFSLVWLSLVWCG